jgi:hypothetical protein
MESVNYMPACMKLGMGVCYWYATAHAGEVCDDGVNQMCFLRDMI